MNITLFLAFFAYFIIISFITAIVTIVDKKKAIKHKYRIPEATLLLLGVFGGAISEYITMKMIRHKTLHKKFMIGLPLIIISQAACLGAIFYFFILT